MAKHHTPVAKESDGAGRPVGMGWHGVTDLYRRIIFS
jgi:hypothetical protein